MYKIHVELNKDGRLTLTHLPSGRKFWDHITSTLNRIEFQKKKEQFFCIFSRNETFQIRFVWQKMACVFSDVNSILNDNEW